MINLLPEPKPLWCWFLCYTPAGVGFDLVTDTEAALDLLIKTKYDLVISDMGRSNDRSAGLDLIGRMKGENSNVPIIIFTSANALKTYGTEALKLGPYSITSSITGVLNSVQQILSLNTATS